jgi:hypothetical protein
MSGWTDTNNKVSRDLRSSQAGAESLLFSPLCQNNAQAQDLLLNIVRRDPQLLGVEQTRWTLDSISLVCDWLRLRSTSGVWRLLDRIGISWKWGRDHIYSPDPDYDAKLAYVKKLIELAKVSDGQIVVLYLDELTYYRQPSLAHAYEQCGKSQPKAERSYQSNTATRIVGAMNPLDGKVIYRQAAKAGVSEMVAIYRQIWESYPNAKKIYVVQDNWSVHYHSDVLVALEKQEFRWPIHRPSHWPDEPTLKAKKKWGDLNLPIQIVSLPTYASWTNPIEKLWRMLKQKLIHLHRSSDDLVGLRSKVCTFLDQFSLGSKELIHYVGLALPS